MSQNTFGSAYIWIRKSVSLHWLFFFPPENFPPENFSPRELFFSPSKTGGTWRGLTTFLWQMRKPKLKENECVIPGCSEIDDFLENLTEVLIIHTCTVQHEIVPQLTGLHGNVLLASLWVSVLFSPLFPCGSLSPWLVASLGDHYLCTETALACSHTARGSLSPWGPSAKCIFSPRGTAFSHQEELHLPGPLGKEATWEPALPWGLRVELHTWAKTKKFLWWVIRTWSSSCVSWWAESRGDLSWTRIPPSATKVKGALQPPRQDEPGQPPARLHLDAQPLPRMPNSWLEFLKGGAASLFYALLSGAHPLGNRN